MSAELMVILVVGGLPLIAATVLLHYYERARRRAK